MIQTLQSNNYTKRQVTLRNPSDVSGLVVLHLVVEPQLHT